MIRFLVNLCVGRQTDPGTLAGRTRYGMFAGAVGLAVNLLLFVVKFTAGALSGSVAMTVDAVNNLSDAGSAVVMLIGFKLSAKPADQEHPFGHGRLEYIAALIVAVMVLAVGVDFLKESIQRIISPTPLAADNLLLAIFAGTLLFKLGLFFFYRYIGTRLDSPTLRAVAFDSLSDLGTTATVVIAVFAARYTTLPLDGCAGTLVAIAVLYGGIKVLRQTVDPLLGECPNRAMVMAVRRQLLECPGIRGVHDVILHNYGPNRYFGTAHAEIFNRGTLATVHDMLEAAEVHVAKNLPVRLVLHCDPFASDDPESRWHRAVDRANGDADEFGNLPETAPEPPPVLPPSGAAAPKSATVAAVAARYPVRVNAYCEALMRQSPAVAALYTPDVRELEDYGLEADGLGEAAQTPVPKLIRRYHDRAVVLVTDDCFVHCRFCFRKRLWQAGAAPLCLSDTELEAIGDFLDNHPEITDILLSGGDVLTLGDARVLEIARRIRRAGAVATVRICSRAPAVAPERITTAFAHALAGIDGVWFVTHFDHPDELTDAARDACRKLVGAGVPVLNQTVLLAGINDDAETLRKLFKELAALRVKPHYLFHIDPVEGVGHFATGAAKGLAILEQFRSSLSSLATPVFAVDLPGGAGKVSLYPDCRAPGGAYWSAITNRPVRHVLAWPKTNPGDEQ